MRFRDSVERSLTDRSRGTVVRLVATVFAIVFGASCLAVLTGCNENSLPTAPPIVMAPPAPTSPPVSTSAHVRGTVLGVLGAAEYVCIDATLEILDGPQAGQRAQQSAAQCEEDAGDFYSYSLDGLSLGTGTIRIRASAPGFHSQEKSFLPEGNNANYQESNADFLLGRIAG